MWFIQTPVDALALPTDHDGRTTLTGRASAWHHLVRDNTFAEADRGAISEMPLQWSLCAWQQVGRRVQLHESIAIHEHLAEMVRVEPYRACVLARYPQPGMRQSDNTLELIIVVSPEQFTRYEALLRFAMTLPAGHVSLTLPSPVVPSQEIGDVSAPRLITPGTYSLVEGLKVVIARGAALKMSSDDLRQERRSAPVAQNPAHLLDEETDDWLLFAAQAVAETPDVLEGLLE